MKDNFSFHGKQAIIVSDGSLSSEGSGITGTGMFRKAVSMFIENLEKKKSHLLSVFPEGAESRSRQRLALKLLGELSEKPADRIMNDNPELKPFFRDIYTLDQFVENLYNYWRSFERFFVCISPEAKGSLCKKPYRTFESSIEKLNDTVRMVYRDIRENITGDHPRIYRQVAAGCQIGVIASERKWPTTHDYRNLLAVPMIRQVMMHPPLILDPPMNKRSGEFRKVEKNPLEGIDLGNGEWLCYPAKICDTVMHVFFHHSFIGLGVSLANLFELADDEDLEKKPDAVYVYGVPEETAKKYGDNKTVFYEDKKNDMMVGAVPVNPEYGYFGYLKKMMLTLHNVVMMKRGRMPFHGAMVRITLRNGKSANVIILGDTGAGKSETLEALRILAKDYIRDMTIISDDMGALDIEKGRVVGYGTETGAFVRLDDLQPGFAFGNIDRSIIMSPQKINARAVIPITTLEEVTRGYPVDFIMYANNYDKVSSEHPVIELFDSPEKALKVFREGARMAKGTTGDEKGIVNSYFANIFGPSQYREMHEKLAVRFFSQLFKTGVTVGQMRTMLGLPGHEAKGPENSAKALFREISKR